MTAKVYDCFCYFNEDMLLGLRLEELWDCVDVFVIVESVKTISGKPKSINFNIEKFKRFESKIRYVLLENYPFPLDDPWRNERYQRDYIANGLYDAKDDDLIIVSDLDEIPRPETIRLFDPKRFIRGDFQQSAYSYYLNNQCFEDGEPVVWPGSKIVTYRAFKQFFGGAEQVREYKPKGLLRSIKRLYFRRFQAQAIANGGWHFTWIAKIPQIIQKLESYAHQEFNTTEFKDPARIRDKILAGKDFLNPRGHCVVQGVDGRFPRYLKEHPDAFAEWIVRPEAPSCVGEC